MSEISGKEVFRWTPPADMRTNVCDDIAEKYVITELPKATSGGIIIWAKYHGKWSANPWNTRTIVRRLLDMIAELEADANIFKQMNKIDEKDARITELETAISETLKEKAHLADGDNCTLIKLKQAMPESEAASE